MDFGREAERIQSGSLISGALAQASGDSRRQTGLGSGARTRCNHGCNVSAAQLYTLSNRITVDVRWRESSGSVTLT